MSSEHKIIFWTPIKMKNERLPNKNTLPLDGIPLCRYVLNELKKSANNQEVYVFCSDERLEEYLPEGVRRVSRPVELDSFQAKISDVCAVFANVMDADIYVYAQVTSPFLTWRLISEGLDAVRSGEYDSALSVKRLQDFLWTDGKPFNYDPANIARTQDLTPFFQETGGVYIYTKELIAQHRRRTGFKPYFIEVSEIEAIDIDYKEDFELAQAVMSYRNGKNKDDEQCPNH